MNAYWVLAGIGALSFMLTAVIRHYALKHQMLDIPNERSSHIAPTPRGGGLAIILSSYLALVVVYRAAVLTQSQLIAFCCSTALVALVGFLDDRYSVPAKFRLLVHALAALWALYHLNAFPPLQIFSYAIPIWSVVGVVGGVLYLVWMLNLYNFMDGIDGIASIQAISVCLSILLLSAVGTTDLSQSMVTTPILAILCVSCIGFLLWNFPKAKIFMGDAGSGFLGMALGLLSLLMAQQDPRWLWCWLILLGVFVVDASLTLIRRLFNKEAITQAHCSHAYQHAAQRLQSHVWVSMGVALINFGFLLPVAFLVKTDTLAGPQALVIAYLPLLLLALFLNAGKKTVN